MFAFTVPEPNVEAEVMLGSRRSADGVCGILLTVGVYEAGCKDDGRFREVS